MVGNLDGKVLRLDSGRKDALMLCPSCGKSISLIGGVCPYCRAAKPREAVREAFRQSLSMALALAGGLVGTGLAYTYFTSLGMIAVVVLGAIVLGLELGDLLIPERRLSASAQELSGSRDSPTRRSEP